MGTELPQFNLENGRCWSATFALPSWRGFQSRNGHYGSQESAVSSDGVVRVVFAPEGRSNEPLKAAELSGIRWVLEHEALLATALLSSLVKEYPSLQTRYSYSEREKAELMPDIASVEDLRTLIGLHHVYIHQVQRDGIPYVGFEFGCMWDEEHGLGVLMHGSRTVDIGGADTAFLLWIAETDARERQ